MTKVDTLPNQTSINIRYRYIIKKQHLDSSAYRLEDTSLVSYSGLVLYSSIFRQDGYK